MNPFFETNQDILNEYIGLKSNDHPQFYKFWKPHLRKSGFYSFLSGEESYLDFQNRLENLADIPLGFSLALASMVEVNVVASVLDKSIIPRAKEILEAIKHSDLVVGMGVSEPGFEGKLKNLSSKLENGKLTGIKSYITNGGEADIVLWVLPKGGFYPVYAVNLGTQQTNQKKTLIETEFAKEVTHLKLEVLEFSINNEDLVLEDYGNLGIILRLKELLSLVSLLLGKTKPLLEDSEKLTRVWNTLKDWKTNFLNDWGTSVVESELKNGFPYPIEDLLSALAKHFGLNNIHDLSKIDPDYQLFLWDDAFTKYLKMKKNKNL
ncbi:acyl-CoA dehydrogenase [Leptospira sp. 96542]|nr:acyl-CoA dehydrogenase [Leptospira sp. 96542]